MDTSLKDIQRLAEENYFPQVSYKGVSTEQNTGPDHIEHLLTYVKASELKPLNIVCNGGAGAEIDANEGELPFKWTKVHHEADGKFPHGVSNPLLEENQPPTIADIKETRADMGIAWDGDLDRCFFFDETGDLIESYYIVGLLAEA